MGVVNYYSVDGEILGDSHAGDYMRAALGSVTGTCSATTGSVQNTYRFCSLPSASPDCLYLLTFYSDSDAFTQKPAQIFKGCKGVSDTYYQILLLGAMK